MRWGLVLAGVIAALAAMSSRAARADHKFPTSQMVGPLFGIAWGGDEKREPHLTAGIEGGIGLHELLVFNAGATWRGDELFSYVELDGWFFLGGTLGFGHGTRTGSQAVLGVWEMLPYVKEIDGGCDDATLVVFSAGYRWTGMHELYVTGKYGDAWEPCWD